MELKLPMSERELRNAAIARSAAAEGMVLLKNENQVLPLSESTKKLAFYGGGAVRTVRSGTGSGDPFNGGLSGKGANPLVNQSPRYHVNIIDSFIQSGYTVVNEDALRNYAEGYDKEQMNAVTNPMISFAYPEFTFTNEELAKAAKETDTAIYVISRICGEGADRNMTKTVTVNGVEHILGDYELSPVETESLKQVAAAYQHVIVVLNVGGVIHMSFLDEITGIDGVLYMSQGGQEGGNALFDVVTGAVIPSGKLTATWARQYADYPASATFAYNDGDVSKELYTEGIYVGYRYFDTCDITPYYEFGYGLSYTSFDISTTSVLQDGERMILKALVKNTGTTYAGKEVVQVYYSASLDGIQQPYQELAAFQKTKLLEPGESQELTLRFRISDMASYHEEDACYRLSKGDYVLRVGNSSRNTSPEAVIHFDTEILTEQLHNHYVITEAMIKEHSFEEIKLVPKENKVDLEALKLLPCFHIHKEDITFYDHRSPYIDEKVTTYTQDTSYTATMPYETVEITSGIINSGVVTIQDILDGKATLEEFVSQLSLEELAKLNCGTGWGVSNEDTPIVGGNSGTVAGAAGETYPDLWDTYGLPSVVLADGPAGVRVCQEFEAKNVDTGKSETIYQYCTSWPIGVSLAQSFDTQLLYEVGAAIAEEMEELGITIFLGPGLNIHRDPLCGRNFEYYSEDPLVSGIMAAAMTKGIQSRPGTGACIKHFAANNQESNRYGVDTIVGQRALREIYLKGFEIAVKTSQPMSIMTSYNLINGVPTADSFELNTNIARGEWGFEGNIMTDWNGGQSTPYKSMHGGNDLIMPGGISRVRNIELAVENRPPVFEGNGQISLQAEKSFMVVHFPLWNSFTVSENGEDRVTAKLDSDYSATLENEQILVNGKPIYLDYKITFEEGKLDQDYTDPVTTKVAEISPDGKEIIYYGTMEKSPKICLGDLQRCAMNNMKVIMKSLNMIKSYPNHQVLPYSDYFELEQ